MEFKSFSDRINPLTLILMPFRKKRTNGIDLRAGAFIFAGSGSRLLRVLRILSKEYLNPDNPMDIFSLYVQSVTVNLIRNQEAGDLF
jgi:hypothetical protein